MIWNSIPNEERLRLWKKLREELITLNPEAQLMEVAKFCAAMPIGSRSLDYYSPADWPTPWEILFHGSFCTSSISLLIFYTLTMIPTPRYIELHLVEDEDGIYLMPVVDNIFVLNYQLGSVNNYPEISDNFRLIQKYTKEQVKTIN
mgnify:CR=1 FL=1